MKANGIAITVCLILDVLCVWAGYHLGVDNLSVLLTVGGGIGLACAADGNGEGFALACFVLGIVGCIFAFAGVGFLAALALFGAFVVSIFGMSVLLQT